MSVCLSLKMLQNVGLYLYTFVTCHKFGKLNELTLPRELQNFHDKYCVLETKTKKNYNSKTKKQT